MINDLNLALPDGSPLPPPPEVPGRLRTAEEWREQQPELYAEVRNRILGGDLNVSALAAEYAGQRWNAKTKTSGVTHDAMRRAITAMINEDPAIGIDKFRELRKLQLEILQAESVTKASELVTKATKADQLGAVAMTMKLAVDTQNAQGGAPTVVIEHRHTVVTPDAVAARRQQAAQQLAHRSDEIVEAEVIAQTINAKDQATRGA